MSNRTTFLAITPKRACEKEEAKTFFKNLYPSIFYDEESDSYEYRGYKFDYFRSGTYFAESGEKSSSYLLVDQKYPTKVWLFDYGDQEEMFQSFLKSRSQQDEFNSPVKPNKNIVIDFMFSFIEKIIAITTRKK